MSEPLFIPDYFKAITDGLKALSWVMTAEEYPEVKTQFATPAVFVSIPAWEPGEGTTGQTYVDLTCDLYLVCDKSATSAGHKPGVYITALAADLSQWVDGADFGLTSVYPAIFTGSEVDGFDPNMDDYLVRRVSFVQSVAFGEDPFASNVAPLLSVWLGVVPDVGPEHIADYTLIAGQSEVAHE